MAPGTCLPLKHRQEFPKFVSRGDRSDGESKRNKLNPRVHVLQHPWDRDSSAKGSEL